MKKILIPLIAAALIVILIVSCNRSDGTIRLEVVDTTVNEGGYTILTLDIQNDLDSRCNFSRTQVWVTTDQNFYDLNFKGTSEIPRGHTQQEVNLGHIQGNIQKIEFSQLKHEDNDKHEDRYLKNIVVYDSTKGITYFESGTTYFDQDQWLLDLLPWFFIPFSIIWLLRKPLMLFLCAYLKIKLDKKKSPGSEDTTDITPATGDDP